MGVSGTVVMLRETDNNRHTGWEPSAVFACNTHPRPSLGMRLSGTLKSILELPVSLVASHSLFLVCLHLGPLLYLYSLLIDLKTNYFWLHGVFIAPHAGFL